MSYTTLDLAAVIAIPNGTKLDFTRPDFNDELSECKFSVTLRTGVTQARVCSWDMTIKDGESDAAAKQASPAVGLNIEDLTRWIALSVRATPTGFTDLFNLWRAGNTPGARKTAFKSGLFSGGHLDASLAASP
jgi:hypothetical protein